MRGRGKRVKSGRGEWVERHHRWDRDGESGKRRRMEGVEDKG